MDPGGVSPAARRDSGHRRHPGVPALTRNIALRGIIAGVVGGAALAVWFLIVDAVAGEAFRTPSFLSATLLGSPEVVISGGRIALYSAIHFGSFALIGVAVAWIFERVPVLRPHILWGIAAGLLLFTMIFYASLMVTGEAAIHELGWPQVLIGSVIGGMTLIGTLSMSSPGGAFPLVLHGLERHGIIREGIVVGFAGGVVVAAWMHLVDLVQVRPFFTPGALGSALFLSADSLAAVRVDWVVVLAYTFVHFAAFLVTGIIAAAIVWQSEETPSFLFAGVLLFVVSEAFIMGMTAILAAFLLGALAWWTIAVGNVLGAAVMGYLLLRAHPKLRAPQWIEGDSDIVIPHFSLQDPPPAGGRESGE